MPLLWKAGLIVLVVCLVASMAIAAVRLATTPTEILGDGFPQIGFVLDDGNANGQGNDASAISGN